MAEYVRFRLAAARVGASMALLALAAGVADKARAASHTAGAQTAAAKFLKLGGLTKTISYDFNKHRRLRRGAASCSVTRQSCGNSTANWSPSMA